MTLVLRLTAAVLGLMLALGLSALPFLAPAYNGQPLGGTTWR
jgi:hypothetical protein